MPSSTMWTAVLQATAITIVAIIFGHHTQGTIFEKVREDPIFREYWFHMENGTMFNDTTKAGTGDPLTIGAGNLTDSSFPLNSTLAHANGTASNSTINDSFFRADKPFYKVLLPQQIVLKFIEYILLYHWYIWLERLLPARPRRRDVVYEKRDQVEESSDREEEVVKKWIAQGRVRRASLNWCNTFLKLIIEMSVGRVWYFVVGETLRGTLDLKPPTKIVSSIKKNFFYDLGVSFFFTNPLRTLIAFILVPAHRQLPFMATWDLVLSVFFTYVLRLIATWAVKTDFAQSMMNETIKSAERFKKDPDLFRKLHGTDEL